MTALEILNALKADTENAMLYMDHEKRKAAFHPGGAEVYATSVSYADAKMARTDPSLNVDDLGMDNELIYA
jgi:hypothetical protein